jgi:hypothetical protein
MSVSTAPNVTIGPGVQEFLRKNDAESAFQTICEIIRECFPDTRAIDAQLEEDHDEPGWWRVTVDVTLADSITPDTWVDQHKRYHELRGERIRLPENSLFVTAFEFSPE